jgi:hypothetical protein
MPTGRKFAGLTSWNKGNGVLILTILPPPPQEPEIQEKSDDDCYCGVRKRKTGRITTRKTKQPDPGVTEIFNQTLSGQVFVKSVSAAEPHPS